MNAVMKDGWNTKPLEKVATFSNGLWKGKKAPFRKAKVLRNTNFRPHGSISFDEVAEIDVECKQFEKRQLRSGDIILERSGGGPKQPVGRAVLFELEDDNYSFSNFTSVIRVIDRSRLDPRFLHQVLNWWHFAGWTERIQSRSTGIRNLDFKAYKQFLVPLPPLEEQRLIVAVLDESFEGLDCACANVEANLQDVDDLFQSFLAREFSQGQESWKVAELNDHVRFIDYRGKTPPKADQGVRLITAKNVKMGFIQREPEEFVTERAYEGWMTRGFPQYSDVLFTTEAPLGNVAQLDTDERVIVGQRLITMQPDQGILLSNFLKFALMSPQVQTEILSRGTGATVVGIKARLLKTVPIRFPKKLEDQRLISERCQRAYEYVEELRLRFISKLRDLDDSRQSLLQRAFAGELI